MGFLLRRPRNILSPQALIRAVPVLYIIFFLMLFVLIPLPVYFLQRWCLYHASHHKQDIPILLLTNLWFLNFDTHKWNTTGCWHKIYLFWHIPCHSILTYIPTALSAHIMTHRLCTLPDDVFNHVFYLQIFWNYHLVFANNFVWNLMQIIFSGICYLLMAYTCSSYFVGIWRVYHLLLWDSWQQS